MQSREHKSFVTFGKPLPRIDSYEKVTGGARYTYDFELPRMLYAKVKRSPVPHARIVKIDVSRAERLPGVKGIITGKSYPTEPFGLILSDTHILAVERVLYAGEPVAAVAAENLEIAEEAIDLIDVEYAELPPVLDALDSLSPNPPAILHPNLANYKKTTVHGPTLDSSKPNANNVFSLSIGDVEQAFRNSDIVVENNYRTQAVSHFYTEPNVCLTNFERDGTLVVYSSTQSAYRIRQELGDALQISPSRIRVIVPYVGGGFGNKLTLGPEPISALLSKATRRPVKLAFTREESMIATNIRHPFIIQAKSGANKDGRLTALKLDAVLDGGAYSSGPGIYVASRSMLVALNIYRWPNLKLNASRAYTNKSTGGAFRGFGDAQVGFAEESQVNMMASELGIDPIEMRLRNLLKDGDLSGIGERMRNLGSKECLESVKQMQAWAPHAVRKEGPWRFGRGTAMGEKHSMARTTSAALVHVRSDETIEVLSSATEIGSGAHTVLSQIAAEEFRTSIDKVRMHSVDTRDPPVDEGAYSSRQTFNSGNAVRAACADAKRQIFERASRKLDAKTEDLEIEDGVIHVKSDTRRKMRLNELFTQGISRFGSFLDDGESFIGKGLFLLRTGQLDPQTNRLTSDRLEAFHQHTAGAVDLAVNVETGRVRILNIGMSTDVGRVVNPSLLEGQFQGGAAMAMSANMFEDLQLRDGRPINADLKDYKILGSLDIPIIEPIMIEIPQEDGPFGAKGAGEVYMASIAPAVAAAIYDAVGVWITELPITPERVLEAIVANKARR